MSTPEEVNRAIAEALEETEKFAGRLTAGAIEDHIRRSVQELRIAESHQRGVEAAVARVVTGLNQLGKDHTAGRRRRDFERQVPSVNRLAQAIEGNLLPVLRRAGYQV